jgi:hypothetical protein
VITEPSQSNCDTLDLHLDFDLDFDFNRVLNFDLL